MVKPPLKMDAGAQQRPMSRTDVKYPSDKPGTPFADPKREPKEELKGRQHFGKIGPSPELLTYIDSFHFPYLNDVTNYEKLLKIGQGTFG